MPGDAGGQQPADRSGAAAMVAAKNPDKVVILAKNVGNAPVLRTTQFAASASHPFAKVIQHIQVRPCCGDATTALLPACCRVLRRGPHCPSGPKFVAHNPCERRGALCTARVPPRVRVAGRMASARKALIGAVRMHVCACLLSTCLHAQHVALY